MHDGPGMDALALRLSPSEDEAFRFLVYTFPSHLCNFISSALLYRANLDGWDALGMYRVEGEALLLVFGLLLDFFSEILHVTRPIPSPTSSNRSGWAGTPVGSESLPLQSGLKTATILPRHEDHHILCARQVQDGKAVIRETIAFCRDKRKRLASLAAITTAIKSQVPVVAGSSSKSVQPLLLTGPKEESVLDTAIPVELVDLNEKKRTAFV